MAFAGIGDAEKAAFLVDLRDERLPGPVDSESNFRASARSCSLLPAIVDGIILAAPQS
jgi:hypothetical protein